MGQEILTYSDGKETENTLHAHVFFDLENTSLIGQYPFQMAAYRAKRVWVSVLESVFLLKSGEDFLVHIENVEPHTASYKLTCQFLTSCGRYAFWRITHEQAHEAQYQIETAHLPRAMSLNDELVAAADLSPIRKVESSLSYTLTITSRCTNLIKKIASSLRSSLPKKEHTERS